MSPLNPNRLGESPMRTAALGKPSPRTPTSSAMQGSPKKLDGSKVVSAPGGEGVLANFFNSLLHKKSGASPGGTSLSSPGNNTKPTSSDTDKATMRSDAAAELDRLARKKSTGGTIDFNASDC